VYCKICKYYCYSDFIGEYCKKLIKKTVNTRTGTIEIIVNDLRANNDGDCPHYERSWDIF